MTNFNLIIKKEAEKEIIDAFLWYEQKLEGLGERFFNALGNCYKKIDVIP